MAFMVTHIIPGQSKSQVLDVQPEVAEGRSSHFF